MKRWRLWILVILLAATFFRLHAITNLPPGMTHDEADHGQDAWGVVSGIRPIYFSVGYGREPLYDYTTAGLMTFLGPTFLAGRLAAAFFSLLLVAATYSWTVQAFDRRVALLTAAGLAISFWGGDDWTSRLALSHNANPLCHDNSTLLAGQKQAGKRNARLCTSRPIIGVNLLFLYAGQDIVGVVSRLVTVLVSFSAEAHFTKAPAAPWRC